MLLSVCLCVCGIFRYELKLLCKYIVEQLFQFPPMQNLTEKRSITGYFCAEPSKEKHILASMDGPDCLTFFVQVAH